MSKGVKNIALVDFYGMNGGAEKVLLNLHEILSEKYISTCFFPENSVMIKKKTSNNILSFNGVFNLVKKIRENRIDTIVLNNKKALKYLLILKFFFPKVKIIFYSHSFFRTKLERVFYHVLCLPFLDKTICVSESLKENHTSNLKRSLSKHDKIYNGFDYAFKTPIKKDEIKGENDRIKIFFWAQFREWKGHLFFIDVLKLISKENSKIELHLVANIQDQESQGIYHLIKDKVKAYGLESIVFYHLDIENHLQFIYENADVSLSCSKLKDPLPTIVIESLSMGVPMLSVNLGGSKEMLREYPYMLSSLSESIFLKKLKNLINKLDKLNPKDLQEYYKSNFSKDIYKKNILNFFQNI